MSNTYHEIYALSNISPQLCEVTNIIHTELGKCFLLQLKSIANLDAVASSFYSSKEWICLDIYTRGILGGHFGWIKTYHEENISSIQDSFVQNIWTAFLQSLTAQQLPIFPCDAPKNQITPSKLRITLYDFDKRARMGFFATRIKDIQTYLAQNFPAIRPMVRFKDDDTQYYYLIFENKEQQAVADKEHGMARLIECVHNFCRENDPYGIFANFIPCPEVTDKETLQAQGLVMGIMRNNPDFDEW